MKLDPEDLKRQYAEYPDEFLLELKREDLTDLARACYDEEIARRGLALLEPEEELPAQEPDEEPAGMTAVVGRFQQPEELADARDALLNAGIPCAMDSVDPQKQERYPYLIKVAPAFRDRAIRTLQPEAEPGADDNLQAVATFLSTAEAEEARELLEAADIPCQVALMVPAELFDRACEILDRPEPGV